LWTLKVRGGGSPVSSRQPIGFAPEEIGGHAVGFWLSTEDLPRPENRVTVERDRNIKLSYTPTNELPKKRLYDKLRSMLNHLGMHEHLIPRSLYMKNDIGIAGCAHPALTAMANALRVGDRLLQRL
jgi:hypothetical protein